MYRLFTDELVAPDPREPFTEDPEDIEYDDSEEYWDWDDEENLPERNEDFND